MAFPKNIAEMLKGHPAITRDRVLSQQHSCQGAKFHSPTPLIVHEVTVHRMPVFLCGTCRDNLHLLAALTQAEGALPWPVLREFGTRLRMLLKHERKTDG